MYVHTRVSGDVNDISMAGLAECTQNWKKLDICD